MLDLPSMSYTQPVMSLLKSESENSPLEHYSPKLPPTLNVNLNLTQVRSL